MTTKQASGSDAIIGDITGASEALKANVNPTESMVWDGVTYTAAEVEGQFDGFIQLHDQAVAAKDASAKAAAAWKAARPEAKAMWATYVSWVELNQGKDDATKKKFNIPVKAPKVKPTAEQQAVRNARYRVSVQKRNAAKAAAAPKTETVVAYDASGNVIGANPEVPVAPAAGPVAK